VSQIDFGHRPLLEVKDLHIQYTSGKQIIRAVNGASFSVQAGTTLGLVGETGAGKTSVAKAILRVLPNPPASLMVPPENVSYQKELENLLTSLADALNQQTNVESN